MWQLCCHVTPTKQAYTRRMADRPVAGRPSSPRATCGRSSMHAVELCTASSRWRLSPAYANEAKSGPLPIHSAWRRLGSRPALLKAHRPIQSLLAHPPISLTIVYADLQDIQQSSSGAGQLAPAIAHRATAATDHCRFVRKHQPCLILLRSGRVMVDYDAG